MANTKLTDLSAATPASADFLYFTDTSDTTDNAAGSSRKVTLANLLAALGLPRCLFDHYADAGNTGTGETDLYSDTLAAGQLATNGDKVTAVYGGIFANPSQTLRVYFGGTKVFDSGSLSVSSGAGWLTYVEVIRESSSVVRAVVSAQSNGISTELVTYTRVTGLTLANTQVLKITGQTSGLGSSNDTVAKQGYVTYTPAAS